MPPTGAALRKRLAKIEVARSPFALGTVKSGRWSKRAAGAEHWVKPKLVAEVSFAEWTPDGRVRQPVFQGLRSDKAASAITRETATEASRAATPSANRAGTVKVSHPERIIDPSTGLKKLNLVRYYESIGEWMLPHLKGRPVSLVRGPRGISGQLFFQKHDDKLSIPGLRELDPALSPGHAALLEVPTAEALVSAAQMNVIEFHTWNSTIRNIDKPDRMVFDLDPGAGVAWTQVQEAALLTRALLTELGLASWLKTSGGKGLHIVVPLAPRLSLRRGQGLLAGDRAAPCADHFGALRRQERTGQPRRPDLRRLPSQKHGATTASAFSARARPGLGVSMPVAWEQLATLKSGAQWTISTAREHLSFQKTDPWAGYWTSGQTLTAAMKVLGFKARPAKRLVR